MNSPTELQKAKLKFLEEEIKKTFHIKGDKEILLTCPKVGYWNISATISWDLPEKE